MLTAQNPSLSLSDENRRLKNEIARLQRELEAMGEKNVELAFQVGELEAMLTTRPSADLSQALRRAEEAEKLARAIDLDARRAAQERARSYEALVESLREQLARSQARVRELELAEPAPEPFASAEPGPESLESAEPELAPRLGEEACARDITEPVEPDGDEPADEATGIVHLDGDPPTRTGPLPRHGEQGAARTLEQRAGSREALTSPPPYPEGLGVTAVASAADDSPAWEYVAPVVYVPAPAPETDPEILLKLPGLLWLAEEGRWERLWAELQELAPERPSRQLVELGLLALVGMRRYSEALPLARLLGHAAAREGSLREPIIRTLEECAGSARSAQERKQLLLELGELHLGEPQKALAYLKRAEILPDRFPGSHRLDYHMTCLLNGRRDDRRPYLLSYMEELDRPELFEHLWQVYGDPRFAFEAPVARAIIGLAKQSRAQAEASVQAAHRQLFQELTQAELAAPPEPQARFLNRLWQRIQPGCGQPSPGFQQRLERSEVPPEDWGPALELHRLNPSRFELAVEVLRRKPGGTGRLPLVEAFRGTREACVLLAPEFENLPLLEQRFLLLRTLYQLSRGHMDLRHRRSRLTLRQAHRLVEACGQWLQGVGLEAPELPSAEATPRELVETLGRWLTLTRRDEVDYLLEYLTAEAPFEDTLDRAADRFASGHTSVSAASYALVREMAPAQLAQVEEQGFRALYNRDAAGRSLRIRLQRLWADPLRENLR